MRREGCFDPQGGSMPAPTGPSPRRRPNRFGRLLGVVALALATALVALAPAAPAATSHSANAYHQTNLVSDLPGLAQLTDPDLVNPWGLAAGPTTPMWVAVNGSPITKAPLVVNIPGGAPTGQVFNGTAGFEVQDGAASGPALFLFDSEA